MNKSKMSVEDVLQTIVAPEHPWFNPDVAIKIAKEQLHTLLVDELITIYGKEISPAENTFYYKAVPLESINRLFGKGE